METKESAYGYVQNDKVFLKAWGESEEREIGMVKDGDPETSIKYFEERFQELVAKVEELEKLIEESENKGSFLMKLMHMKDVIQSHDGLGDYQQLHDRLESHESLIKDIIAKNRERNTEIKKALVQEVKEAVEKINWKEATEEIHDIKNRWIKTGNAVDEENDQLEEAFWGVVQAFFEKKKSFYEDKRRLMDKTKDAYENLVAEARNLNDLHGRDRFQKVKQLKDDWAALGNIPKQDYGPLIDEFNRLLKPGVQAAKPNMDIEPIISSIDQMASGVIPVDLKKLDEYKSTLKGFHPFDHKSRSKKGAAFGKIQLLKERAFISSLARKRNPKFNDFTSEQKTEAEIKILEDLLSRDKEQLKQYNENAEKFATGSGQINPLVEKQLHQQKTKVTIKEELLEILKKS